MTVPTLITDLSVTPATNAALISGSDSPIVLDDHLRTVYAFIASVYANSGNGWASPYLPAANPVYTGTLTGGTGVVNLGSGQFYKDGSGNVGIGVASPAAKLDVNGAIQFGAAVKGSITGYNLGGTLDGAIAIESGTAPFAITRNTGTLSMGIDASGNVGIGGNAAATAILDLQSTAKGLKLPVMTSAQKTAIANTAGLMVYDSTLGRPCFNSGSAWVTL